MPADDAAGLTALASAPLRAGKSSEGVREQEAARHIRLSAPHARETVVAVAMRGT